MFVKIAQNLLKIFVQNFFSQIPGAMAVSARRKKSMGIIYKFSNKILCNLSICKKYTKISIYFYAFCIYGKIIQKMGSCPIFYFFLMCLKSFKHINYILYIVRLPSPVLPIRQFIIKKNIIFCKAIIFFWCSIWYNNYCIPNYRR